MSLLVGSVAPEDLEPRIISMAISRAFRVKQIGTVFFVENCHLSRTLDTDGVEHVTEDWRQVAIAKGDGARREAMDWMGEANKQVLALMAKDRRRAALAARANGERHD